MARKDDELPVLTILGILFTGLLVYMDFKYSSIGKMHIALQAVAWLGQIGLAAIWVIVFGKWQDPKYDKYRQIAFVLVSALILWVGIHHATAREDNQVIIDSRENALKDSTK